MATIEAVNRLASAWSAVVWRGLIESTALLLAVGLVWLVFRRKMPSQLAYGLFLLVLIKLAVPIPLTVPASWRRLGPIVASEPPRPAETVMEIPVARDDVVMGEIPAPFAPIVAHAPTIPPVPAPPVAVKSPKIPPSIAAWLMMGWLAIVCGLLARFLAAHANMYVRLRSAEAIDPASFPIDLADLHRRAKLRRAVPIFSAPWIGSPAVWGLIRPRLLVPPDLSQQMSRNGLTWVLLHELIHVRRRDGWVVLFQRLVQIAYFFHPAVWVANRMIDIHREFACDDAALAASGVSRRECGEGFLKVVERANASPSRPTPALGLLDSPNLIRRRLMRILDGRRPLQVGLSLGSATLLVIVGLIALPRLKAQDEPAKESPKAEATRSPARSISAWWRRRMGSRSPGRRWRRAPIAGGL